MKYGDLAVGSLRRGLENSLPNWNVESPDKRRHIFLLTAPDGVKFHLHFSKENRKKRVAILSMLVGKHRKNTCRLPPVVGTAKTTMKRFTAEWAGWIKYRVSIPTKDNPYHNSST